MLIDKDNGYAATMKFLTETPPRVETGVFGSAAEEEHTGSRGATVGDVANWMHVGTRHVPARPWITNWWDAHGPEASKVLVNLIREAKFGNLRWNEVMKLFGNWIIKDMRKEMLDTPPPLTVETFKRKGHDQTLFEGGQLQAATNFRVVK